MGLGEPQIHLRGYLMSTLRRRPVSHEPPPVTPYCNVHRFEVAFLFQRPYLSLCRKLIQPWTC